MIHISFNSYEFKLNLTRKENRHTTSGSWRGGAWRASVRDEEGPGGIESDADNLFRPENKRLSCP